MLVQTVNGTVDSSKLGTTLMHEHIVASSVTMLHYFGNSWLDEETIVQRSLRHLAEAKKAGVTTIVDGTPLNLGRDIRLMAKIAKLADINMIASTGMYYPADFAFMRMPYETLAKYFIDECTNGIQDTGIKPAILKCSTETNDLSECDKAYLATCALTTLQTNIPIYVHTNSTIKSGLTAVDFILSFGVKPDKIIVGHCIDALDIDYPLQLLDKGTFICPDRIFRGDGLPKKTHCIAQLIKKGFASKICLAHDHICCENKWNGNMPQELKLKPSVHDDEKGLAVVPELVPQLLLQEGITQQQIDTVLRQTPQAIFEA